MKIALGTIEVDNQLRRAIAFRIGKPGLASRKDIANLCHGLLGADLEQIRSEGPCADCEYAQNDPESGIGGCAKHVNREDPLDPNNIPDEDPEDYR